jgi:putative transport protein
MVSKSTQNIVPISSTVLSAGDAVLVVAESQDAIASAAAKVGKLEPGRLASDRTDLDYIRVFVAKANVVGIPLASLPMPSGFPTHLLHVRRYDADLVPSPDLMLEFGDRVGVLTPPDRKEDIRKHFGDTVKATAEFSYVSLGLGMVMGVLLGLIPIPIPGVGVVTLGIGGGPLIVALILGKLRRTGPMLWTMPLPANIVLRNFGLAMFLATVGVNAGQPFVRTVAESGFTMLFIGVAILLTTVAIVLLVGHYIMRIPYDDLVGVASGATGNPAILVYSTKMAPTDRPDIGYAMIFPSMTLVKVIAVQIVGLLTIGGASGQ